MTDDVRAWLDHTHTLDQNATPGPWSFIPDTKVTGERVLRGGSDETGGDVFSCPRYAHTEFTADAEWIAHSRTALPAAVAALRAVLGVHQSRRVCHLGDDSYCDHCGVEWPCPTVAAVRDKIGDET